MYIFHRRCLRHVFYRWNRIEVPKDLSFRLVQRLAGRGFLVSPCAKAPPWCVCVCVPRILKHVALSLVLPCLTDHATRDLFGLARGVCLDHFAGVGLGPLAGVCLGPLAGFCFRVHSRGFLWVHSNKFSSFTLNRSPFSTSCTLIMYDQC